MRISDWSSDVCSADLQIERFVAAFGRENIATVIYDDFAKAPQASYRRVLEFLGVSPDHEPQYAVVNSARVIRSVPLHRWLIKPPIDLWNPERLLPSGRLSHRLQWRAQTLRRPLSHMNPKKPRRPPIPPAPPPP